ncbi:MAG: hypothetical protein ABFQ53_00525 [Patescibacteria group bacterium]
MMKIGEEQMYATGPMTENNIEDAESFKKARNLAQNLYEGIPYHSFNHIQDTIESADEIIAKCEESGMKVDNTLVMYSLLFHDAGYHENHKKKGFKTKEGYSAFLAERELQSLNISEEDIMKIKKCIISTHRDEEANSVEEKIVRAADLVGLAGDYKDFKENAIKLKQEAEMRLGDEISQEEWKKRVRKDVEIYLKQDIRLTNFYEDENGESVFHKKTRDNLERFLKEAL